MPYNHLYIYYSDIFINLNSEFLEIQNIQIYIRDFDPYRIILLVSGI